MLDYYKMARLTKNTGLHGKIIEESSPQYYINMYLEECGGTKHKADLHLKAGSFQMHVKKPYIKNQKAQVKK